MSNIADTILSDDELDAVAGGCIPCIAVLGAAVACAAVAAYMYADRSPAPAADRTSAPRDAGTDRM